MTQSEKSLEPFRFCLYCKKPVDEGRAHARLHDECRKARRAKLLRKRVQGICDEEVARQLKIAEGGPLPL